MEKSRTEKVCEKYDYDVLLIANLLDEYNDYCYEEGRAEEVIYTMDKLDYYFSSYTPTEILDEVFLPKFNPSDYYFKYTINGVVSSDYLENLMDASILEELFKKWEDE